MEENNIIICEKCYEENEATRSTCKNCGATLYHNERYKNKRKSKSEKETKNILDNEENKNDDDAVDYINASNSSNEVANKFLLVVAIVKAIGYVCAIITGLIIMTMDKFWLGLLVGLLIAVMVWSSTLIFEAIAEGLNLLQDIKNKL